MSESGFRPLDPRELERMRSVGQVRRRSATREGRDPATGERYKSVTDDAGNVTTERGGDRVDVEIRPATIRVGVAGASGVKSRRPARAGQPGVVDPTVHSAAPCRWCGQPRSAHTGGACP